MTYVTTQMDRALSKAKEAENALMIALETVVAVGELPDDAEGLRAALANVTWSISRWEREQARWR